jgi:ubiquitin carboxyl-terminal hydrolase 7
VNRYHLHSILVHRGTANSGHYYAFIKPSLNDKWFEFNDDKVTEVTKEYAIC